MAKLEYGDEASRLVEAINTVPDTIGRRQAILRALSMDNGNISKAAELLGISRPTLYDLMNKHALK